MRDNTLIMTRPVLISTLTEASQRERTAVEVTECLKSERNSSWQRRFRHYITGREAIAKSDSRLVTCSFSLSPFLSPPPPPAFHYFLGSLLSPSWWSWCWRQRRQRRWRLRLWRGRRWRRRCRRQRSVAIFGSLWHYHYSIEGKEH